MRGPARLDGRLRSGADRRRHKAQNRLADAAARLASLSPLAVLGRGYAVAWNADRTRAIRAADETRVGDRVQVTLATGELECEVVAVRDSTPFATDA